MNYLQNFYLGFELDEGESDESIVTDQDIYSEPMPNFIDTIPKTFTEYYTWISSLNNSKETSLFPFVMVDVFWKLYNAKPDDYRDFYNGFAKYDNFRESAHHFYYNILRRVLTCINDYIMYYKYSDDKDEIISNMVSFIKSNTDINREYEQFKRNLVKSHELLFEELGKDQTKQFINLLDSIQKGLKE